MVLSESGDPSETKCLMGEAQATKPHGPLDTWTLETRGPTSRGWSEGLQRERLQRKQNGQNGAEFREGEELRLRRSLIHAFPHPVPNTRCDARRHWLCPRSSWDMTRGTCKATGSVRRESHALGSRQKLSQPQGEAGSLQETETRPGPRHRERRWGVRQ